MTKCQILLMIKLVGDIGAKIFSSDCSTFTLKVTVVQGQIQHRTGRVPNTFS